MKQMKVWRWVVAAALVLATARVSAGSPRITSLTMGGDLVFETPNTGTIKHNYRVEGATSLGSVAWSMQRSVCGVGASARVTNPVSTDTDAMFYRVVATSNSATFVDGPYMAIDLSAGASAANYLVTYYPSAASVPGGVTNDTYKTTKILMRLITKGCFTSGGWSTDYPGAYNSDHLQITLTKNFFIGVFEVTQRQWELVMGNRPSYFENTTYYQMRPVEMVSYYEIRENPLPPYLARIGSAISPNWPQSSQVHPDSFMGRVRAKTGLATFDLPTNAQWIYARRAGTTAALNSGKDVTNADICPNVAELGRYLYNGGGEYSRSCDLSAGTAIVGSYLPNAWGLYDMHGNVWEKCLDWWESVPKTLVDPTGPLSGTQRMALGGGFMNSAKWSANTQSTTDPNCPLSVHGFRVAMTLP